MTIDILFLRYPSEVSLIVSKNSRSLFHNNVWFIYTEQGACTFKDENGNFYAYAPGKVTLGEYNNHQDIPYNEACTLQSGNLLTKMIDKNQIIQIARQYFKPLSVQKDNVEALVSLRDDDMGFYLS
ncbi:hypothetical protein ETU08_05760 [Apibacter muscae]|nr:hypothetical protein [Apibacter muscae]TWP30064.1 hypothetical protein ETU08_05760 [Apibacter muscae]